MSSINSYKDLKIWIQGIELVQVVYQLSSNFPQNENFNLTSQIRRCSVSIPSNIAEAWGRGYNKNLIQFLKIARGSLYELETQIIIAEKLNYIKKEDLNKVLELVLVETKMINSLISSINNKIN